MAKTNLGANVYTWAEFLAAITPAEYGAIRELADSTANANVNRQARYALALWEAENRVDFTQQRTVDAVTWLVTNTAEWTGARATQLATG